MSSTTLVYYPGHHGVPVAVQLRSGRGVRFDARDVRRVPAQDAKDLMGPPPLGGGFCEALSPADAAVRFGLSTAALDTRLATGALTFATFRADDAEPVTVVVLDPETVAALRTPEDGEQAADSKQRRGGRK